MTTANKITIFRILLVPFFVFQVLEHRDHGTELSRWLALGSFALAALSDGVDGFLARRLNQRSVLGAVLDPLADKLLLVAGVVTLTLPNRFLDPIPRWLTLTIISRDVLLVAGGGLIHLMLTRVRVRPRWTGKTATVFQMAVVLWTLLKLPVGFREPLVWAATILTAASGLQYVVDGMRQLASSPVSSPETGGDRPPDEV